MLPATVYRPRKYPPGPKWPQWGDPQLDKAFASLSEEAHRHMVHKHDDMRNFHKERLEKQGLTQVEPEFYSMNAQTEDEPTFSGQATQTDYQTMDQGTSFLIIHGTRYSNS